MTPLVGGLLVVAAVAAVADWVAIWYGGARGRTLERIAKPAVMVALIGAAVAWPAEAGSTAATVRSWLVAGLAASLVGDVLLLPPGRFVAGLAAFLIAHIVYLAGFLLSGVVANWVLIGAIAAAAVAWTAGGPLVRGARRAGLGTPVALYMAVILAMAAAGTGTHELEAIAGAWLFVTSDTLLGWGRFVLPRLGREGGDGKRLPVAVMVTYHVAQLLIVLALVA